MSMYVEVPLEFFPFFYGEAVEGWYVFFCKKVNYQTQNLKKSKGQKN